MIPVNHHWWCWGCWWKWGCQNLCLKKSSNANLQLHLFVFAVSSIPAYNLQYKETRQISYNCLVDITLSSVHPSTKAGDVDFMGDMFRLFLLIWKILGTRFLFLRCRCRFYWPGGRGEMQEAGRQIFLLTLTPLHHLSTTPPPLQSLHHLLVHYHCHHHPSIQTHRLLRHLREKSTYLQSCTVHLSPAPQVENHVKHLCAITVSKCITFSHPRSPWLKKLVHCCVFTEPPTISEWPDFLPREHLKTGATYREQIGGKFTEHSWKQKFPGNEEIVEEDAMTRLTRVTGWWLADLGENAAVRLDTVTPHVDLVTKLWRRAPAKEFDTTPWQWWWSEKNVKKRLRPPVSLWMIPRRRVRDNFDRLSGGDNFQRNCRLSAGNWTVDIAPVKSHHISNQMTTMMKKKSKHKLNSRG